MGFVRRWDADEPQDLEKRAVYSQKEAKKALAFLWGSRYNETTKVGRSGAKCFIIP